jgi:riboflavin kinase/FMN adenylyltransferase
MKVIESESQLVDLAAGAVLTIGNFDGVHIGHQAILSAAKRLTEQKQTGLVVMTFQPHPLSVLNPKKAHGTLTPPALKEHLLAELGTGTLFVMKSEPELLSLRAEDFAERFIVRGIRPSVVVEGEDFNFGAGRAGSVHTLQKLTEAKGIKVFIVEPKKAKLADGHTVEVSSTVIRDMVTKGKVADALVLLGRPYRLIGSIVPGRGKGKELGFPTLNMKPVEQIIPAEGVYAGTIELAGSIEEICGAKERIPAVFSLGRTETYGSNYPLAIEAHLLIDNAEQLIGRYMAMDFVQRIRNQHKFKTDEELSAQIAKDREKAKEILATEKR